MFISFHIESSDGKEHEHLIPIEKASAMGKALEEHGAKFRLGKTS